MVNPTVVVHHSTVTGAPADPAALVDGPAFDAAHNVVVTGLENVPNVDATNASNITSGTLPAARLPNPTASTLGGVESIAAVSNNWINSISTSGVPSLTQPAITDISGLGTGIAAALAINTATAGAPVLYGGAGGTPSAMVGTNISGTAAGLTAGNATLAATVTTNANLTGPVTSVGNATAIANNQITRAMEAQGVARSVVGVTGNATANVADIQLSASQFLGTNAGGTSLSGIGYGPGATAAAGQLPGTATNDNASAGNVGEYIAAAFKPLTATVTVTIASPAVVTWTTNPYSSSATGSGNWTAPIIFTTTGALPTGITASTVYWVIGSTLSGDTFQFATSIANALAGTAVNTSGTQSGTQTGNTLQPFTNSTGLSAAAISLPAGDWDVRAVLYGDPTNASTSVTDVSAYLSTTLNTSDVTPGRFAQIFGGAFVPGVGAVLSASIPPSRFSSSSSQTIHLVGLMLFTVSTMSAYGAITARRVR